MPTVAINITGGSYTSRSRPLSAQVTRNFYPEATDNPAALSPFVLHAFPGLKAWNTKNGKDRGLFVHNGILYHVAGETLYTITSAGTATSRGTIAGSDRCIFAGIGTSVVIVTGGRAWVWNGTTLAEVGDSELESPNSAAHLNNYIIYDGDNGRFASSDVGDAASIDALNYATAESNADDLIRVYAYQQTLYMMGNVTTETWFNSGTGSPPFDRIEGGIMQVGLGALHSVSSNDRLLYWLGDDREVYIGQGATAEPITDSALANALNGYAGVDDAIGFCMKWENQRFYVLTLPAADKTWIRSEATGRWFELSSGTDGGRWIGNSHAYAFGKHFIADHRNGNVYQLDGSTYDDAGDTVVRVRDTGPLHGGLFGVPGKPIEMARFELVMETGVGLTSGQGSDPEIMLSYSDDGGRTFSTERRGKVGGLGQYMQRVEWHAMGQFHERIIRVKTSDPVFFSIHSAAADLEVGI